jgi:hypothetical protein
VNGRPDPLLVQALTDPVPVRRGAAAEALAQHSGAVSGPALKNLLQDADSVVRLQTALALAGMGDRDAVPVLIGLVGQLPVDKARTVEEYLGRLAGNRAGAGVPAADSSSSEQRRDAWNAWWQAHGAQIDMENGRAQASTTRYLGRTLLVETQANQVVELGPDGRPRLTIANLASPADAQVLPGDHVLVAEQANQQITERTASGEVIWQKTVPSWPIGVERLRNGNTFIACRGMLMEVDRLGREVFTCPRPANDIMTARKLRDGRIVIVSSTGTCVHLDASGKEVKSFRLQGVAINANQVLANGNVIMLVPWQNKLNEYGPEGQVVWQADVVQPVAVWRLPNGNTLVSTQGWPVKLVEIDRSGRTVAETTAATLVSRLRTR